LVNIDDILLLRDLIFGAEPASSEQKAAADVNGMINIDDILGIRDIIFGA